MTGAAHATVVHVALAERAYDVVVGAGLIESVARQLPATARHVVVVTQPTIRDTYAATVATAIERSDRNVDVFAVPDGEAAKTLEVLSGLYERVAQIPLGRDDAIVAVGGGAVCDLAGFLAATWNRGIAVVHAPTTLLAQVDAAIGGKTAVNLPAGKNLVGSFHQPTGVVADVATLATLPRREVVAGLGEVVKSGLIGDPAIVDELESDPDGARTADPDVLTSLVARSARVKARVVAADERESGEREHLNFGHTYGHALEAVSGYESIRHGEAVALGMLVAVRLGLRMGITDRALVERTTALLDALGLPTRAPSLDRAQLWGFMRRDKKARAGVRFVLVEEPGVVRVVEPEHADVDAAIDAVERDRGVAP